MNQTVSSGKTELHSVRRATEPTVPEPGSSCGPDQAVVVSPGGAGPHQVTRRPLPGQLTHPACRLLDGGSMLPPLRRGLPSRLRDAAARIQWRWLPRVAVQGYLA